jgi:hypothetical protein
LVLLTALFPLEPTALPCLCSLVVKIADKSPKSRFFHENDFYEKIAQKIGSIFRAIFWRFFGKNRDFLEKIAGHWQKIVCLKKFRKPQGGGGMMCFGVQRRVIFPY